MRVLAQPAPGHGSSTRECKERRRAELLPAASAGEAREKLREIREQVAQGKLVIRKMTAEERGAFPPRRRRRASARSDADGALLHPRARRRRRRGRARHTRSFATRRRSAPARSPASGASKASSAGVAGTTANFGSASSTRKRPDGRGDHPGGPRHLHRASPLRSPDGPPDPLVLRHSEVYTVTEFQ